MERLREEALDLARARNRQLIFFRKLVHAENGDDVLERLVLLQRFLNAASGVVMLLADHAGLKHAAGGIERVNRGINAQL